VGAPTRARHRLAYLLTAVAVVLVAILVVGVTVFGWWRPAPSAPPPAPLPSLDITFAANSTEEVESLLTTVRPYIEPGDSFDLVSGSPENSTLSVPNVNRWAAELRDAFPGHPIYAHTAGLTHYAEMAAGVGTNVSGILYDYEPGFEPEFTFNFTATLSNFRNVSEIAQAYGVASVGYPVGRPILEPNLAVYGWNYATLAGTVDALTVQTQTYCKAGASTYAEALSTVLGQYATEGLPSLPEFQITIGNATTTLPNGVTAGPAYDCAAELAPLGLHSLYLWWNEGALPDLLTFLADIGRG